MIETDTKDETFKFPVRLKPITSLDPSQIFTFVVFIDNRDQDRKNLKSFNIYKKVKQVLSLNNL